MKRIPVKKLQPRISLGISKSAEKKNKKEKDRYCSTYMNSNTVDAVIIQQFFPSKVAYQIKQANPNKHTRNFFVYIANFSIVIAKTI